jgi:hypothetical protein
MERVLHEAQDALFATRAHPICGLRLGEWEFK